MIPSEPPGSRLPADLSQTGPAERFPVSATPSGWLAEPQASLQTAPLPSGVALLQALRQRWLLAAAVGLLLGAAVATTMWFMRPAKYTAFALLRVASTEPTILRDSTANRTGENYEIYRNTQIVLIKSPPVLAAALKNEKVRELPDVWDRPDPVDWLGEQIRAYFVDGTEILRIEMSGQEPATLATLVNAVKFAYLEEAVKEERKQRLARFNELDNVYRVRSDEVRKRLDQLKLRADQLKVPDPRGGDLQRTLLHEEFSILRKELSDLETDLRRTKETVAVRKTRLQSGTLLVPELAVEDYLDNLPRVKIQAEQIFRLEFQIEDHQRVAKGSPDNLRAELALARKGLEQLRLQLRPAAMDHLRKRLQLENQSAITELEEQIEVLTRYSQVMRTAVAAQKKDVERIGKTSFELEMQAKEIEQADAVIGTLRAEKERLQVEIQSAAQRITTFLPAEVPQRKDTTAQLRAVITAGLGAFLLGAFGVAFLEFRARRISTADAVVNDLGMRVLGTLPSLTSGRARRLSSADAYWRGVLSESVDGLRAILAAGGANQVLLITSARDKEGKTMLATFLASSLARAGRRTLLVDWDLRRPAIHELLALPLAPGLAEVLCGKTSPEEAIRLEPVTGLDVLPAGQCGRQALQTLAGPGVSDLFGWLRRGYDFIIVDSCPVLPVADSLLLAPHVDGVLMSIRFPVSRVPQVHAACERLRAVKARVLGTVVQGTPGEFHDYKYSYLQQSPPLE